MEWLPDFLDGVTIGVNPVFVARTLAALILSMPTLLVFLGRDVIAMFRPRFWIASILMLILMVTFAGESYTFETKEEETEKTNEVYISVEH